MAKVRTQSKRNRGRLYSAANAARVSAQLTDREEQGLPELRLEGGKLVLDGTPLAYGLAANQWQECYC